jgi:hypothetical protein
MWVWGVWYGFALRCVALLCGVFVLLRLALFPAGGPFLPLLYVNLLRVFGPIRLVQPYWGVWTGPVARPFLSLGCGGLRLSATACLPVALAGLCGCGWGLSRVSVSCVACVCLCLASALCLSAPMLPGVSLVPLCNTITRKGCPRLPVCRSPWLTLLKYGVIMLACIPSVEIRSNHARMHP